MFGFIQLAIDAIVLQQIILLWWTSSSVCGAFSLDSISQHVVRRRHIKLHRDSRNCTPSAQQRRMMITLSNSLGSSNDETSSSSSSGIEGLQERMRRQEQQYANLFSKHRQSQSPHDDEPPETVYLILFHNKQQQQQHIHTIEYPMGSKMNYILAFIDEDDCINFATSLQRDNNLNNPPPMVEVTMFEPFAIYCDMNSMRYIIVPRGFGLTPPQMNANDDDVNNDDDDDNYDVNDDDDDDTHDLDSWG